MKLKDKTMKRLKITRKFIKRLAFDSMYLKQILPCYCSYGSLNIWTSFFLDTLIKISLKHHTIDGYGKRNNVLYSFNIMTQNSNE